MWSQLLPFFAFVRIISAFQLTVTGTSTTSTNVVCKTKLSKNPFQAPIPTQTKTKTEFPEVILVFSESTPILTVTPSAATVTATSFVDTTVSVTASTVTDTFSTTSTETDTSTVTSTLTFSDTSLFSTTTTTTTTSTVPTPAGFVGVESSSGDTNLKKRDALGGSLQRRKKNKPNGNNPFDCKNPAAVICTDYVTVVYIEKIIDVKRTSTSTLPIPTSTTTTTSTLTSTSTILPTDASTTLSFSTTTTLATTATTSTTTTISTTITLTATSTALTYAACASTNILGPQIANGDYLTYTDVTFDNTLYEPPAGNPYDCCVACITSTQNCAYSVFSTSMGYCLLIEGAPSCKNPGFTAGSFYETVGSNVFNTVYSNGLCGTVTDGGVVAQ